jgi:hypothetical protein
MARTLIAAVVVVGSLVPVAMASAATRSPIALSAPASAEAEQVVPIAVRTAARVTVTLHAAWPGGTSTQHVRTGRHGRATLFYDTPFSAHPYVDRLRITARVAGHMRSRRTSIAVHPFEPEMAVRTIQVLRLEGGSWATESTVAAGDSVRITVAFAVLELAGWYAAPCARGTVTLTSGQTVVASLPLQCSASTSAVGAPVVYADWTVPSTVSAGTLHVTIDLSYDEGRYGIARGEGATSIDVTDSGV